MYFDKNIGSVSLKICVKAIHVFYHVGGVLGQAECSDSVCISV